MSVRLHSIAPPSASARMPVAPKAAVAAQPQFAAETPAPQFSSNKSWLGALALVFGLFTLNNVTAQNVPKTEQKAPVKAQKQVVSIPIPTGKKYGAIKDTVATFFKEKGAIAITEAVMSPNGDKLQYNLQALANKNGKVVEENYILQVAIDPNVVPTKVGLLKVDPSAPNGYKILQNSPIKGGLLKTLNSWYKE